MLEALLTGVFSFIDANVQNGTVSSLQLAPPFIRGSCSVQTRIDGRLRHGSLNPLNTEGRKDVSTRLIELYLGCPERYFVKAL